MTLWDDIVEASPPAELDEVCLPAVHRDTVVTFVTECAACFQVKRLLGSELIDSNQALQDELQALKDMFESLRLQTESLSQQRVLVQTTERSLVRA